MVLFQLQYRCIPCKLHFSHGLGVNLCSDKYTVDKMEQGFAKGHLYYIFTVSACVRAPAKRRLLVSSSPSVRMHELGSHWTDCRET